MKGSSRKHKVIVLIALPIIIIFIILFLVLFAVGAPRKGFGGCADIGGFWDLETKKCTSDLKDNQTVKRLKYINSN
ncbi:MAG TPA: hypothetical protein PLQ20_03050 [Candidatus Paceibacterota bacterium]|nr:hypothetical protein [Candidatus Paceibacterota bacterium]